MPQRTRVRWDRLAFRRSQIVETACCSLELRVEAADAEAGQCGLHSIDDAALLGHEAPPLTAGPFGILLAERGNGDHLAVLALAAEPAEEGPL
jgi:hypothetical protein